MYQQKTRQQFHRRILIVATFVFLAAAGLQGQERGKKPAPPADGNKQSGGEKKRKANTPPAEQPAASPSQPPAGNRSRNRTTGNPADGNVQAAAPAGGNAPVAPPTGGNVPKPTGKNLSDKQKKNVNELIKDLQDIKAGSTVTQEQINALAASLTTLAQGTTKPDPATVNKLAADLADVLSDGGLSNSDIKLLAQDINAVLNSANIPQAEIDAVIANAQAIFVASGVNKGDALEIQADLQAIAQELKKNVSNATQSLPTASPSGARRRKP